MRTRKRLREKETQVKSKKPKIPLDEDFLEADYLKVQKLLDKLEKGKKCNKSNDPANEDRSSTEAEQEHTQGVKNAKDNWSEVSSNSSQNSSTRSKRNRQNSLAESHFSDKKRISNNNTQKLKSSKRDETKAAQEVQLAKRRTMKEENKIKKGFSSFFSLLSHLNSEDLPKYLFQVDGNQSQIDEEKDLKNPHQELCDKQQNCERKNSSEKAKDCQMEICDPQGKDQKHCEQSKRIQQSPFQLNPIVSQKTNLQNIPDGTTIHRPQLPEETSVTLLPNQFYGEEIGRPHTELSLNNNQSLHVRCAYFINTMKSYLYYQDYYQQMMQYEAQSKQQFADESDNQQSGQAVHSASSPSAGNETNH